MNRFEYLGDRIEESELRASPFLHLYIENFLSESDFLEVTKAQQINLPAATNDAELLGLLHERSYQPVPFPGCVTDEAEYLDWHSKKHPTDRTNTACEGFGITYRLTKPESGVLQELKNWIESPEFNAILAAKFGLARKDYVIDSGIHKYLDGYEISPHPDIRRKALTFMVNINPHTHSSQCNHHTHYLKFKPEREYIATFWQNNPEIERCWVPWDWCRSIWSQTANNSIVVFAPGFDTLHGVLADYDHLGAQRTQLYGNLWHPENPKLRVLEWEDLDLVALAQRPRHVAGDTLRMRISGTVPVRIRDALRRVLGLSERRRTDVARRKI